jgi:hypothetical protein
MPSVGHHSDRDVAELAVGVLRHLGFRFDLAANLARRFHEVDRLSAFFDLIQQDPIVSQVKLIAEPWDIGDGGYQVGNFPPVWTEWNGTFRDTVRDFWRGEPATLADFTSRRRTDVRRAMERRPRPHRDDVPQRRRDQPNPTGAANASSTTRSWCCSTPTTNRCLHHTGCRIRQGMGDGDRHCPADAAGRRDAGRR